MEEKIFYEKKIQELEDEIRNLKEQLDLKNKQLQEYAKDLKKTYKEKKQSLEEKIRFESELEIAASIQKKLLPFNIPDIPGVDMSFISLPARHVGGDYLGIYTDEKSQLSIGIGDVMGKGIPAALLMTTIRAVWRSIVINHFVLPAVVLETINSSTYEDFSYNDMFMSLFHATYDLRNKLIYYSNAAHNPPLYLNSDSNEIQELDTEGSLIGFELKTNFIGTARQLNVNDLILFYTDGVIEIQNKEKKQFGVENLKKIILEYKSLSTKELLDIILDKIYKFEDNTTQNDDLTIFILKIK